MQHRVPVLYPREAVAAEVLTNGLKIDATNTEATAADLLRVTATLSASETLVQVQAAEIDNYAARPVEDLVIAAWRASAAAR